MFVDTVSFHPLDIPRSIVEGFLPYWPKGSPLAGADDRPRSELLEESAARDPP
jgi:hypothetical protein